MAAHLARLAQHTWADVKNIRIHGVPACSTDRILDCFDKLSVIDRPLHKPMLLQAYPDIAQELKVEITFML